MKTPIRALAVLFLLGILHSAFLTSRVTAQAPSLDVFPHDGAAGEIATFKAGARLFANRNYALAKPPAALDGMPFLRVPIQGMEIRCTKPGELLVLTPIQVPGSASIESTLLGHGFTKETRVKVFQLFGSAERDRVSLFRKTLKAGETLTLGIYCIVLGPVKATFKRAETKPWTENDAALALCTPNAQPSIDVFPQDGDPGEIATFKAGARLFTNRNYALAKPPAALNGMPFLRVPIQGMEIRCTKPGELLVLTPIQVPGSASIESTLLGHGFTKETRVKVFQLFGSAERDRVSLFRKALKAGETLRLGIYCIVIGPVQATFKHVETKPWTENDGEVLYNGIVLPREWPPRNLRSASVEPMPVPYLENPPAVIPIDIGRQLFVDDFLVETTTLRRVFHAPKQHPGNPVFVPSTEAELRHTKSYQGQEAVCHVGMGGVFYDPADSLFKMWYDVGWVGAIALATSRDAFEWTRPALNAKGENIVIPAGVDEPGAGICKAVYLDIAAKNETERHKFLAQRRSGSPHTLHVSKDGLNWSRGVPAGRSDDYCSFYFNPFRNVWVQSIKRGAGSRGRARHYAESPDFLVPGIYDRSVYWVNADRLDKPHPDIGDAAQLYMLHGIAYESIMLGMFHIHLGPNNRVCDEGKFPKAIDLKLGFSRDGFHWDRPEREPFIKSTRKEGDWNRGYLQGGAGVCLVVGDWLYFPYTGASGVSPTGWRGQYTGITVGMAILRRDGFASMEAGAESGVLATRPVRFSGRRLFVNVDCPGGELLAEVLDATGAPVAGFTKDDCLPVSVDKTLVSVAWKNGADLSALADKPVRFRFYLGNGKLYSFWVSRDDTGRSDGYVAGGGPGYTGLTDTVGAAALEAR